LLVLPGKGLVIFCLVENQDISNYKKIQDDSYNKIESKLRAHKELMTGRKLEVEIYPVTFAPVYHDAVPDGCYPICNENNLQAWLDPMYGGSPEFYEKPAAVLQAISTIRKG
jgi:hypothetical protein